jgi:hypothetical protein
MRLPDTANIKCPPEDEHVMLEHVEDHDVLLLLLLKK